MSANGLLIKLRAPAARLAHAFHTDFERVALAGGQVAYANTRAPQFSGAADRADPGRRRAQRPQPSPRARPRVGHQSGPPRRHAPRPRTPPPPASTPVTPCASASSAAQAYGAYTADEIASAYGFSSLYAGADQGAGQTVALMEFEPYLSSDIATYNSCYGIDGDSASDVSEINVDGGVGSSYSGQPRRQR